MKKFLLMTVLALFSLGSYADVIKADENSIQDDLNFKLQTQSADYDRSVASSNEETDKEKKEGHKKQVRDIANKPQEDSNIQYWEY